MSKTNWINILLTLLWWNGIYKLYLQSISIGQSLVLSGANT